MVYPRQRSWSAFIPLVHRWHAIIIWKFHLLLFCWWDKTFVIRFWCFFNCLNDLSLLSKWCAENELNFNISKCAFICFCPECSGTQSLDSQLLKQIDASFDLGLEVLSNLKWDLHIRTKLSRARNNFNYLRQNAHTICQAESKSTCIRLEFYRRFCMDHMCGVQMCLIFG